MIFNFVNKIFRRTHFGESVTERKLSVQLWNFHQGSYTPQEHHSSDRIFGQIPKYDFFFCLLYFCNSGHYTWSNPHQLPKENSLSNCGTFTRALIPPRNTTLVTEFLDKYQSKTFSFFSCIFATAVTIHDQTLISYQEKHYGGNW